ncbi:hypothetical protein N331_01024, partial [Merops nubicus]
KLITVVCCGSNLCLQRHMVKPPSRVSDSLLILIRLHKEPHEQYSNQDNHEVEEKFLCGPLHLWGVIGRAEVSRQSKGKASVTCLGASLSSTFSLQALLR